jgi:dTDP-4-amino-4,6-dideoxygalactose transaminase
MIKEDVIKQVKELTSCKFAEIVLKGNSAIDSCLSIIPRDKKLLIPEEGGWIHYEKAPKKLGLEFDYVKCEDSKINLNDLKEKLSSGEYYAFLYDNPGGYFAEEPTEEIYNICKEHNCLVFLDIAGSIGTEYSFTQHGDLILGSFGRWKPINAEVGGFIATNNEELWNQLSFSILEDEESLEKIKQKINGVQERLKYLLDIRKKVLSDLSEMQIIHPNDYGLVVIVKYSTEEEMKKIIYYCDNNKLPYTECPRYIRINQKAISIEIKKL